MNKVIGVTASTFDLLHAGHIGMLREAKTVCNYLVCALQVDPSIERPEKNSPNQTKSKSLVLNPVPAAT